MDGSSSSTDDLSRVAVLSPEGGLVGDEEFDEVSDWACFEESSLGQRNVGLELDRIALIGRDGQDDSLAGEELVLKMGSTFCGIRAHLRNPSLQIEYCTRGQS